MTKPTDQPVEKAVTVVDLWRYSAIAKELDALAHSGGVKLLQSQIQEMIHRSMESISINPEKIPSQATGDGAILLFDTAQQACDFGEALHRASERFNRGRQKSVYRRHYRIGICFGEVALEEIVTRGGEVAGHKFPGIAVRDAARLEGACIPGEILICPETWMKLPSGFRHEFDEEEPVDGKPGEEPLRAHRRRIVAPPPASDSADEADRVKELLSKIFRDRTVPKAEGDVNTAIERAIKGVDAAVLKAAPSGKRLNLPGISSIIEEAISHGARIYNAGSFVGCATIYLHAAERIVAQAPGSAVGTNATPPKEARLAAEWLSRIVEENSEVEESTADDLAWELRFAFDSIHQIPLFDQITTAIAMVRTASGKLDADKLSQITRKVVAASEPHTVRENQMPYHVRAYLLRHTAGMILWIIDDVHRGTRPTQGVLGRWHDLLRPVLNANPRVSRYNVPQLVEELPSMLLASDAGDSNNGGQGKWFDPKRWFDGNSS